MSSQDSESESSSTPLYDKFNSGSQYDDPKSSSSEDEGDASSDNDSEQQQNQGKRSSGSFSTDNGQYSKRAKIMNSTSYSIGTASDSNPLYSAQSQRMMNRMNYDKNKGLGKSGQGRLDIIEIAPQKGRRGLGMKLEGLDLAASTWNESMETLNIPEKTVWLDNNDEDDLTELTGDVLESWMRRGPRKQIIDDEDKFCSSIVLQKVLECKSAFDNLGGADMRKARARSNPFETIKSNIFMNRAAVKMANMDAMFDYMFTYPVDEEGNSQVQDDDLVYFADVCAGPGGFSEYFLWRKKWQAKGFGFTLRGENDFKLSDFIAGTSETFDPYYGPNDDGDVFNPDNIEGFTDYVMKQTELGVHVMMADGGFSVENQENIQEILSKRLYLCQIIMALNVVRTGGHFVVKLFDLFTPFSVGLVYLVYKCFKKICICKPNTSRPANSERYLVCKWKKPGTETIQRHLFQVNKLFDNNEDNLDILELVSHNEIAGNRPFFQYIYDSNNEIGENQIVGLLKIAAFCADQTLNESKQDEIKRQCLELWKLENGLRKVPSKSTTDEYVGDLIKEWNSEKNFLNATEHKLHTSLLEKYFPSIHGKGGKDVYYFKPKGSSWQHLKDKQLELAPSTLVYGEIATELQGQGNSQITIYAFHIIDGISLGGEDIRKYSLPERLKMCEKYAKALNKPYRVITKADTPCVSSMPIRCKKLFPLMEWDSFFNRLESYKLKGNRRSRLGYQLRNTIDPERFYVPKGLLFLNEIRDDYLKMFSKTQNKFYYFHKKSNSSTFPDQMPSIDVTKASFKNTFINRVIWEWCDEQQVSENGKVAGDNEIACRIDIKDFIIRKISH
ncbi:cap-specific mRNA (nucleoside-2'-O-)-methyltransferase 1 isoform X2 [Armigeres subalbatus]|uniref:cap-specific mRNA (nucleoside-2'-O-)-methyltransferase 1 isoform X2 n=1 Tax=Armigeres subalbatus TaxID=124917 RepID=UPI002ED58255